MFWIFKTNCGLILRFEDSGCILFTIMAPRKDSTVTGGYKHEHPHYIYSK